MPINKELSDLRSQINHHNYNYYVLDAPLIPDGDYEVARLGTMINDTVIIRRPGDVNVISTNSHNKLLNRVGFYNSTQAGI